MSKRQDRQSSSDTTGTVTGERDIDMHKVAEFAKKSGWNMPKPPSDIELLQSSSHTPLETKRITTPRPAGLSGFITRSR